MPDLGTGISDVLSRVTVSAIIDILIVSTFIYWLLLLLRGSTAMTVLRGVAVLLLGAFLISRVFELRMLNWILRNSVTGLLIGLVIIFQPEIRRALERLGRAGIASAFGRRGHRDVIDVIVRSAVQLGRQEVGALIVMERETGLQEVIDTGVQVNATISAELLGSIFMEPSPLHDGAVIVRGDRLIAAGCTLPLSESPLPADYHGMRHRAALGIVERTDAVVVIVSEERGSVSLASNGRMVPEVDENRLNRQLHRLFGVELEAIENPGGEAVSTSTERRAS